jgi:peptide-methionine (S)-S-oxide reductase
MSTRQLRRLGWGGTILSALLVAWALAAGGNSARSINASTAGGSGSKESASDPAVPETTAEMEITPVNQDKNSMKATFGAGCFWGVEAAFRQIEGVLATRVGYAGGTYDNPSYKDVCAGHSGHAEVVEVEYDPSKVAYESLLEVFWDNHNPTQLNRQGPDVGDQYRSVVFYHSEEQAKAARESMRKLDASGLYSRPIVTRIEPALTLWEAEEYHQQYLEKRGLSTCQIK